jgi:hypothetical protein
MMMLRRNKKGPAIVNNKENTTAFQAATRALAKRPIAKVPANRAQPKRFV